MQGQMVLQITFHDDLFVILLLKKFKKVAL